MQTSWLTCFGKDSGLVRQVEVHRDGLTPCNALDLVRQYDVVVDASDNAPTRYYRFSVPPHAWVLSHAPLAMYAKARMHAGAGTWPATRASLQAGHWCQALRLALTAS